MTTASTTASLTTALPYGGMPEPCPGSVVLTDGLQGTAWQRLHGTGLWHSTTGRTSTWADLVAREEQYDRGGPLLVHDAPPRKPARTSPRKR